MPSERALARALMISRTTVVTTYDELRHSGWLKSRRGSGTSVSANSPIIGAERNAAQLAQLASSPLLGLLGNQRIENIVDFAMGMPLPLTELPLDRFLIPADEYATLINDRLYHPMGIPALRHAIADYFARDGLPTSPDHILVTSGAQQALALCASLVAQRGDMVLVEDPTYFGALDAMRAIGARIASLPVGPEGVRPSVIRERIGATAARLVYLTPTFQNPTGAVMPVEARKELARIASSTGVPVIDDRSMAALVIEGTPPRPLAAYSTNAPIITIGSLSKLVWPGLRVGWVRAAEPIIERLARLKTAMDLGCPLITQTIAVRLFAAWEEACRLRQQQLKPRRDLLVNLLKKRLSDWEFRVPTGGLFLWARLPSGNARQFAQVALRHGIVILPGPVMSAEEGCGDFIRLPFFWEAETLRTGMDRLCSAWQDYKSGDHAERARAVVV